MDRKLAAYGTYLLQLELMKKMVLLGGGRWARVLMSVLADVLPADWRILWITQHGRQAAELWCREQQQQQYVQQPMNAPRAADWIEVAAEVSDAQLSHVQAAIVATSPHTHGYWLQRLLQAQVPTLCEKPLVLDSQQAVELERQAIAANCPLGVNLELHYATYVEEFARRVGDLETSLATALPAQTADMLDDAERRATLPAQTSDMIDDAERRATLSHQPQLAKSQVRLVELQWLDPWSEVRYGETKYSDVYTNIVDDMFPHCWSLLRHATGVEDWHVVQVEYLLNSNVQISLVQGDVSAKITLSRRALKRTRRLSVHLSAEDFQTDQMGAGNILSNLDSPALDSPALVTSALDTAGFGSSRFAAELDFSPEPGAIVQAGERIELQWHGERPLTRSLKSFLGVLDAHGQGDQQAWKSWPLSIVSCRESVSVSTAIAKQLHRAQQQWLDRCSAGDEACSGSDSAAFRRRLLFDMFVPIAAAAGQRVEFTDPQQLQAFYDSIAQRSHWTL